MRIFFPPGDTRLQLVDDAVEDSTLPGESCSDSDDLAGELEWLDDCLKEFNEKADCPPVKAPEECFLKTASKCNCTVQGSPMQDVCSDIISQDVPEVKNRQTSPRSIEKTAVKEPSGKNHRSRWREWEFMLELVRSVIMPRLSLIDCVKSWPLIKQMLSESARKRSYQINKLIFV